ncbi:MAG TPA: phosphoribosyltransferase, partial [Stellaceae bacterium]|nr:phosphoribosyltransferase [Stellaceae bacterium]
VRRRAPRRLVLAAPVVAAETLAALSAEADETVCVAAPQGLGAIGFYYDDFRQLSDDEVIELLAEADHSARLP